MPSNRTIAARQNAAQRKGARVDTLANVGGSYAELRYDSRERHPMHVQRFTQEQQSNAARIAGELSFA